MVTFLLMENVDKVLLPFLGRAGPFATFSRSSLVSLLAPFEEMFLLRKSSALTERPAVSILGPDSGENALLNNENRLFHF